MVIIRMADGFGNQLFRYAFAYAIAQQKKERLGIDVGDFTSDTYRSYQLDSLNIAPYRKLCFPNKTLIGKALRRIHRKLAYHCVCEDLKDMESVVSDALYKPRIRDTYLMGYFFDCRYFLMYEEELRRQFLPKSALSDETQTFIQKYSSTETCALHIRLGDIHFDDITYLRNAITRMKELKPNVSFVLYSNEVGEAKELLKNILTDYELMDENSGLTDLEAFYTLSACRNQILTIGTYGMWAALLNKNSDKTVIVPAYEGEKSNVPEDWILL